MRALEAALVQLLEKSPGYLEMPCRNRESRGAVCDNLYTLASRQDGRSWHLRMPTILRPSRSCTSNLLSSSSTNAVPGGGTSSRLMQTVCYQLLCVEQSIQLPLLPQRKYSPHPASSNNGQKAVASLCMQVRSPCCPAWAAGHVVSRMKENAPARHATAGALSPKEGVDGLQRLKIITVKGNMTIG